jgi:membrane protein
MLETIAGPLHRRWARLERGRLEPVIELTRRTLTDARDDRVTGLAAEMTFFALVAIPPLLLVVAGSLGFVANIIGAASTESMRDTILDALGSVLNDSTVQETVRPTLDRLLVRGRADNMSLGILVALWSCSRATKIAVVAVTLAYDVEPSRSVWRRRAVAIGLTAGAILTAAIVIPLLVVGPGILADGLRQAGLGRASAALAAATHWAFVLALAIGLLATFYHVAPPHWTPWRRDLPGAVLALVLWALGAFGLRTYVSWTVSSDATYGPLAAPIVILLWLYVTSLAVLLGAELNAEIEKKWPTTRGP